MDLLTEASLDGDEDLVSHCAVLVQQCVGLVVQLFSNNAVLQGLGVDEELNDKTNALLNKYCAMADEIFVSVKAGFGQ